MFSVRFILCLQAIIYQIYIYHFIRIPVPLVYVLKVRAGQMETIHMPVLPLVKGNVTITLSATSFMGQDTVTRTINVVVSAHHSSRLTLILN